MPRSTPLSDHPSTIKDVSELAGVSTMSVTRVIRGEKVRPETKKKVNAAVIELNYRPNPMVQSLMRSVRQRKVGYQANIAWLSGTRSHLPEPQQKKYNLIRDGAQCRAHELGFGFEEIHLDYNDYSTKRFHDILKARGIYGVVMAPLSRETSIPNFPWNQYPVSIVGRTLMTPQISHTMPHYQHMMELVLDRLTELSYQRVALLDSRESRKRSQRTLLMTFLEFNTRQPARRRIKPIFFDAIEDKAIEAWLNKHKPDALIAVYPQYIERVRRLQLSILEGVGYVTLSRNEENADITGIQSPAKELGHAAVDIVVDQIHRNEIGLPKLAKSVLIEGRWMEGSTLKSAKTSTAMALQ